MESFGVAVTEKGDPVPFHQQADLGGGSSGIEHQQGVSGIHVSSMVKTMPRLFPERSRLNGRESKGFSTIAAPQVGRQNPHLFTIFCHRASCDLDVPLIKHLYQCLITEGFGRILGFDQVYDQFLDARIRN